MFANFFRITALDKKTADKIVSLFPGTRLNRVLRRKELGKPSIYHLLQDDPCVFSVLIRTDLSAEEVDEKLKDILCFDPGTDRLYGKSADRLEAFLSEDLNQIVFELKHLHSLIGDCSASEEDDAGIDVRLCVDCNDNGQYTWSLKWGDVQFDQEHSDICIADFISEDSDLEELAETLIDSAIDEAAMRE